MRCSGNFTCLLMSVIVLPFCLSRDTITASTVSRITYPGNDTLVSAGEQFELGFFTPTGSSDLRYIGIWYYRSDPPIIVWVANRNDPLIGHTGWFGLLDGKLQLWKRQLIWSTNVISSSSSTLFAKLLDTGNLVLMEDDGSKSIPWRSFDYPTDIPSWDADD
ncbi:hypothetical protein BT93_B2557 [Corymbia citriodora subsp. variegata]|nr:hypothetical protein BT93_B2557 [Corymbia citriodora subsp. variegata]